MKQIFQEYRKDIIKLIFVIVILSFVSVYVSNWLQDSAVQEHVQTLGIFGPIVVTLYIVISHVFAPVAGTPGVVVAFAAFGLMKGWLVIYTASLISAAINFYIARVLGRKWVIKLAGKDSISKIDKFVEIMGTRLLIIARTFGFPLFEFISYAAGFTAISFKKYMVLTALLIPIPGILFSFVALRALSSPLYMALMFITMFAIGVLFSWYTVHEYVRIKGEK